MATRYRTKKEQRLRRHRRLRKKIVGTAERPRMAVCTTGHHIYVQIIDDDSGRTIASCSTIEKKMREDGVRPTREGAQVLGRTAAERLLALGINQVVFDRGGFQFHGRIRAVADAAREAGLTL